jgi:DNA-binding IclR family transcriptional regulator
MCRRNPYLRLAAGQDYERFFETEIRFQKGDAVPAVCGSSCRSALSGEKEEQVRQAAECISPQAAAETFSRDYPNAAAAPAARLGGIRFAYGRQVPL